MIRGIDISKKKKMRFHLKKSASAFFRFIVVFIKIMKS